MEFSLDTCEITRLPIGEIHPYEQNPRIHPERQLVSLEASVRRTRHMNPLLITAEHSIIAGHARYLVARRLGLDTVPVILLPNLCEADCVALRIADNAISEKGKWSIELLAHQITLLSSLDLDFDPIEIGFETPEIDQVMIGAAVAAEVATKVPVPQRQFPSVSRVGDVFAVVPVVMTA